jgi:hypothetical protein
LDHVRGLLLFHGSEPGSRLTENSFDIPDAFHQPPKVVRLAVTFDLSAEDAQQPPEHFGRAPGKSVLGR